MELIKATISYLSKSRVTENALLLQQKVQFRRNFIPTSKLFWTESCRSFFWLKPITTSRANWEEKKITARLSHNPASLNCSVDRRNASSLQDFLDGPRLCDSGHLQRHREAHQLHLPAQGWTNYLFDALSWRSPRMFVRFDRRELLSKEQHRSLPPAGPRVLRDSRAVRPFWGAAADREAPGKLKFPSRKMES